MSYKSILTYYDGDEGSGARLEGAIAVARLFDAHLTTVAIGYDPDLPAYAYGEIPHAVVEGMVSRAKTRRPRGRSSRARRSRRPASWAMSCPLVCTYGALAGKLGALSRYVDLAVLGQPYGDGIPETASDALEGMLFDGDVPVLVCPRTTGALNIEKVLVGWDGSREALRAVRRAMPFLVRASLVEIAIYDPAPDQQAPGEQLATLLARHGVEVDIAVRPTIGVSVANALAQRITEMGADLLVMGAYGHSRFREYVLGGVTRDIMEAVPVPILSAH